MQGKLAGTRIAVIEDDALLSRSIMLFLQVRGARVDVYSCAEEAGDPVFRGGFGLVISSYQLPGENGLSFLRKVKEASERTVTILTCGRVEKELPRDPSDAGVDSFLAKPFSTNDLEEALRRVLERRETGSREILEEI